VQQIISCNQKRPSLQSGFTLIEVLISVAIFSIGVLGVSMMQIHSSASISMAGKMSDNLDNLTDQIEKLIAVKYDDVRLAVTDVYDPNEPDKPLANYDVPPYIPALDADLIDNDGDGIIDEADEADADNTSFVTVRWWVTETNPKAGSLLYNYKTVTIRIERGGPGGSFLTLQRYIPRTVGV
jgi:prepilin-type N-terminal cleavage/methylation domain-containing protein